MADKVKGVEIDQVREKLIELITEFYGVDPMYYGIETQPLVDHLIAKGVTVAYNLSPTEPLTNCQQWIPVTERLPEKSDGHVLVTDGDNVKISCRNAMYRTRGGETWCAQNYGAGMCVTHWMPLPEPPKGE